MSENYGAASVCRPDNPNECLQIEPGLGQVMATSENWDELLWAWKGFRDEVGVPNKPLYKEYVTLSNEAARLNGIVLGRVQIGGYGYGWIAALNFEVLGNILSNSRS